MANKYRIPEEDEIIKGFLFERGEVVRRSEFLFVGDNKKPSPEDEWDFAIDWRKCGIYDYPKDGISPSIEDQITRHKKALAYNLVRVKLP